MLGIQGREQRTERNIYINNNKNIKLRQSVSRGEDCNAGGREFGIGSFHPRVDSPNGGSSRLSRFAQCVFIVLKAWEKGTSMGRQWLHMWNPRLTKITSRRSRVHHVVECCMSSGESTSVLANAFGRINFRTKRPQFVGSIPRAGPILRVLK